MPPSENCGSVFVCVGTNPVTGGDFLWWAIGLFGSTHAKILSTLSAALGHCGWIIVLRTSVSMRVGFTPCVLTPTAVGGWQHETLPH